MIFTLALRNLFHDRIRFAATLIGVAFSMALVTIQLGLYLGFSDQVTGMITHADADLWILPRGITAFEQPALLDASERYGALSTPGVAAAAALVVSFAEWRTPSGESTTIVIVGADPAQGLAPWNLVEGNFTDLGIPDAVIVDRTYLTTLGIERRGEIAQIENQAARVVGFTDGIRSFTTAPYVFTLPDRARRYLGLASGDTTMQMVRLVAGTDVSAVKQQIAARLTNAEVLTSAEFAARSREHWLFSTGAGFALLVGASLGLIVGTAIVAQTLYASTKDHLNEFATLRAIGSSANYIHKVILCQALLSAAIGFSLAGLAGLAAVYISRGSVMHVVVTPWLLALLLGLTVLMCVVSAFAAIAKVTRIDPAMVFVR
jgi:putative ABC transport system permease protein